MAEPSKTFQVCRSSNPILAYEIRDDDQVLAAFRYREDAQAFIDECGDALMLIQLRKEPK